MKVAVIIPCYNVVEHVGKAVRSVVTQTHVDVELVAVDDGSTDGTLELLHGLEAEGQLNVVTQHRKGASAARNAGLRATTGTYIQFLDADDVLLPTKIADQIALSKNAGMPAMVAGAYRDRQADGSEQDVHFSGIDPWSALIKGRLGTTSADLWQRTAIERAGGWDEALKSSQDHELAFRLLRAGGSIVFDDRIGTVVLKRKEGSISKSDPIGNWERYIALRVAIRDHLHGLDAGEHAERIDLAEQLIFGAIRIIARSDHERARALFDEHVHSGFTPKAVGATGEAYARLYGVVGFNAAEWVAGAMDTLQRMIGKR